MNTKILLLNHQITIWIINLQFLCRFFYITPPNVRGHHHLKCNFYFNFITISCPQSEPHTQQSKVMLFSNKCTFMPRIYLNRVINVLNDNISPRVKFQDNAFFHSFFVSPFFLFMISSKIHSHYLYLSLNDIFHFWFFSVVHILFLI